MVATQEGHIDVAKFLLEDGIDLLTVTTKDGERALHIGARQGYGDILSHLMVYGASLTARNSDGHSFRRHRPTA